MINKEIGVAFLTYTSEILANTEKGLSGTQIIKYCSMYAVEYNINIPYAQYPFPKELPNKRTALLKNLQAFNSYQQYEIINYLCYLPLFVENRDVINLKNKLNTEYNNFSKNVENDITSKELIIKTKHFLKLYPKSLKLYEEALLQYNKNIFERNTLDNMRLSLELLLSQVLDNDKSLENNLSDVGKYLKERKFSKELNNMVMKLIDYYSKYQNEYVKHDDNVNKQEIEFIIDLTSIIMKLIIKEINV